MAQKNKKRIKRYHSRLNAEQNNKLLEYSKKSNSEIFHELHTSIHGLTTGQYEKSKEEFGSNEIGNKKMHH
jgi:hypothetical protein